MADKIRILHVVVNMGHGGYENYLMNVFRKIDREKFQFDFLVFKGKECYFEKEINSLGGRVFHCTFSDDFRYFKARKQLKEIIKNNNFDILHCHSHYYSFLFLNLFKKKIRHIILHSHNSSKEKTLKGRIVSLLSKYPSKRKYNNLACSNVAGEYLFGKNGKFELCPNCINTVDFYFDEAKSNSIKNQYAIPQNSIVLGNIGRFAYPKNHAFLIEICKKLCKHNFNFKLCLCGVGVLKDKYLNIVNQDPELKKHIVFLQTGDVSKYYSAFDIFLLPSFSEGFPLSLLESQAAGCFTLASSKVTREVELSNIIKYLSIDDSDIWVSEILNFKPISTRDSYNELIRKSKYDSVKATKYLENYYLKLVEHNE